MASTQLQSNHKSSKYAPALDRLAKLRLDKGYTWQKLASLISIQFGPIDPSTLWKAVTVGRLSDRMGRKIELFLEANDARR